MYSTKSKAASLLGAGAHAAGRTPRGGEVLLSDIAVMPPPLGVCRVNERTAGALMEAPQITTVSGMGVAE